MIELLVAVLLASPTSEDPTTPEESCYCLPAVEIPADYLPPVYEPYVPEWEVPAAGTLVSPVPEGATDPGPNAEPYLEYTVTAGPGEFIAVSGWTPTPVEVAPVVSVKVLGK